MYEFYTSDGKLMDNPVTSSQELIVLNSIMNGTQLCEEDQVIKKKIDEKVINWMWKSFANKNLDMKIQSDKDIICILLDIILYQDTVMVNSAFTLLARFFSQKKSII